MSKWHSLFQNTAIIGNEAIGKQQRAKIEEEAAAKAAADVGAFSLDEFKGALRRKYGNLLRAWKLGLDSDGSGKLSFVEFCQSARSEGFAGNLKSPLLFV